MSREQKYMLEFQLIVIVCNCIWIFIVFLFQFEKPDEI